MQTHTEPVELDPRQALPFDYVQAKIRVPESRPGSIVRTALVNRLRAARRLPVVSVVAPAGYGKTTLLAQFAERDERSFAWVSLDARDDDPIVLLRHLAAALNACEPLAPAVGRALRSPGRSVWTTALPRLAAALAARETRSVIVLDNASELRARESIEIVTTLAQHVSHGSTLVLAGRVTPLPVASLRATGRLLELGPELLALSRGEAQALLEAAGVELTDEPLRVLLDRTEGWAAGLYLAALAIRDGGEHEAAEFSGDDRYLADYFHSEYLCALDAERLAFLRRTALLGWMSGPLCDAVLGVTDSATVLDAAHEANLFVVPLDRHRERYRYHSLFHDLLRRELEQHEPAAVPSLHRRAAEWFEAHGEPDSAVRHAAAAGDLDHVARIVDAFALDECDAGRTGAVEGWLRHFADADLERHPGVAATGAWVHALRGRPAAAERWLALAELHGSEELSPVLALLRASFCRDGVERMLVDAQAAASRLTVGSYWHAIALVLEGTARALAGDGSRAGALLGTAAEVAASNGRTHASVVALTQQTLLAASKDDGMRAAVEAYEPELRADGDPTAIDVLALGVSARVLLRRHHVDEARAELAEAGELAASLTGALPWLAVQSYLELSRAELTVRDVERAQTLVAEAAAVLEGHAGLGVLATQVDQLQAEIASIGARGDRRSTLTSAELRLLPWLATHLSFREIGDRLCVSRNTIKTQAISIYRKLGVSSRSKAIECATRLALIETNLRPEHDPERERLTHVVQTG